jgi:hypothetical protein
LHEFYRAQFNISAWSEPKAVEVFSPVSPPAPGIAEFEAPLWASLPDPAGVSRARLTWTASEGAAGYAIYEANETALLIKLGDPSPDTTSSLVDRLRHLRLSPIAGSACRSAFRRINPELISADNTSFEVALPKGSKVLHLFTVIAVGHNNRESAWPTNSKSFLAFAVPRLRTAIAPSLEVMFEAGKAKLRVEVAPDDIGGQIAVHRLMGGDVAPEIGWMGPWLANRAEITGPVMALEDVPPERAERYRLWYRCVVWSREDAAKAIIPSASAPSAAVSILIPGTLPPPEILEYGGDHQPGSTAIVHGRHFLAGGGASVHIFLERKRIGPVDEPIYDCQIVSVSDKEIGFTVPQIPRSPAAYSLSLVRADGTSVTAEEEFVIGGL